MSPIVAVARCSLRIALAQSVPMADDGFLERIDEHMRRSNEVTAEVREEMRLTREEARRRDDESRAFMQEITTRIERIGRDELRQLRQLGALVTRQSELLLPAREEVRAQTQAIFRLLDRLDPDANGA